MCAPVTAKKNGVKISASGRTSCEQQDDHADLAEHLCRFADLDQPEGGGSDEDPAEKFSDDRGLPESAGGLLAHLGPEQQDEQ